MGEKLTRTCIFLFFFSLLFGLSPGADDVIIDNGDPNYTSFTGTWSVSSGTGAWGVDSLWGRGGATYTWTTDQIDAGFYEVFMWWTQYESRNTAVPVAIVHANGTENLTVNQQINGSVWNSLGIFYFDGTGSVVLSAPGVFPTNNCADAVRFTRSVDLPPVDGVIVDNTDSETSRVGTWQVSGGENPYGTESLYCRTANCSFSWYFTPDTTGYYNVFMWWTEFTSRSTVTPVEIENADGIYSLTVNQQTDGGVWNLLGEYLLNAGTRYRVTIRTLADNSAVCADAVWFVKTSTPPPPPPPPSGTIVDNTDPNTARVGTWPVSGGENPYGVDSLYCRTANCSFSWLFTPDVDGYYEISMWWTELTSRSTAVPVEILSHDGIIPLTVNQQINGGRWNLLDGEYLMYAGTTYSVTVRTLTDNTTVSADAVCFTKTATVPPPPPPPPSGTIIDNTRPNTSRVGTWAVSGAGNPYGLDSLWCRSSNCSFTWYFTPDEAGYYDVYMWWTEFTSRSTAAPIDIQHADGIASTAVNQQTAGGIWNELGTFYFNQGVTYSITIRTLADNTTICADAVRFAKSGSPPPPPTVTIVDNTSSATERVGTWSVSGAPDPYGTNSVYCREPDCSFTWLFTPEKTAWYELSMWWTVITSRSSAAPVEVESDNGTQHLTVDQLNNGGVWNVLGKFRFTQGTTYRVTIRTLTDNTSICADAVRFAETAAPPPPVPTGIIIDNRDATVEMVGKWEVSSGLNPHGTDSVWCRTANCSFTWLFHCPEDGYYNVFMWWTDSTSRSTAAPVEIENADGTAPFTVNQMTNCAVWNLLGEYPFHGGKTYRITIRTLSDNSSVCADAVCFEKTATPPPPPPPPPSGLIIDNTDPNTSRVGTWPVSGGINPWGTDSLYCRTPDCSFTWLFTPDKSAFYEVTMWWTEFSSRSTVTPVEVQHAGGTAYLTVNQQTGGNAWNPLGSWFFDAGTTYSITIRTLTDNSAVCADAVRFEEAEIVVPDTIIDNRDAETVIVGTWPVSGGPNPYGYDSVYCRDANRSFTWQFTPQFAGRYEVSMWWTEFSSRSTATPVRIQHASGTASLTVNQQTNGGKWNVLGNYLFEADVTYNITILTLSDRSAICADAVKLVKVPD